MHRTEHSTAVEAQVGCFDDLKEIPFSIEVYLK